MTKTPQKFSPKCELYILLVVVALLTSCAMKTEQAVLRVEVNAQAWREYTSPPGSFGGWWPPIVFLGDFTRFRTNTHALRRSFERAGMDPDIKAKFRWEDSNVTNVVLFLSTSHSEPERVAQMASNAFVLWLKELPYSKTMQVHAP